MDTGERNRDTGERAGRPPLRARMRLLRPKLRAVFKPRAVGLRSKLIAVSIASVVVMAGTVLFSSYGLLSPSATVAGMLIQSTQVKTFQQFF